MKKVIIGAVVSAAAAAAAVAALRRFGPAIGEHAMNKCHQMMGKCQEMFARQAGSRAGPPCTGAATPGPEQAAAEEYEPAEATAAG